MNKSLLAIFSFLVFVNLIVWGQVYSALPKVSSNELVVAYLDVGQGDAIYVQSPNGNQMIIDGGPNNALMGALPDVVPFGDKSIDVIVITNPDADHMSGFVPLLEEYDVSAVVEPGTYSDTTLYKELVKSITNENSEHILARSGMKIILDEEKNIYFEILFPDRDVSDWERNDGSIVGRLVYNQNSFLFMGDATTLTEGLIVSGHDISDTDVLKIGHHGSKTSTGIALLRESRPEIGIISVGEDNRYGHPHKEVLERLNTYEIPYLETSTSGTIVLVSDGEKIVRK